VNKALIDLLSRDRTHEHNELDIRVLIDLFSCS
jgi:hypothetical protein